jgi:hypothetical protein
MYKLFAPKFSYVVHRNSIIGIAEKVESHHIRLNQVKEKINRILKERDNKQRELEIIVNKTEFEMWNEELDLLLHEYIEYRNERSRDNNPTESTAPSSSASSTSTSNVKVINKKTKKVV